MVVEWRVKCSVRPMENLGAREVAFCEKSLITRARHFWPYGTGVLPV